MNIKTLAEMNDEELAKAMGLTDKLADARKALDEMNKLAGKEREYAEERISSMFEPHVYPDEFKWILEDAQRAGKKGTDEMADCCCRSVL